MSAPIIPDGVSVEELRVCEMFRSIHGEGKYAGTPMAFIRLAGCNVACTKSTQGFDCDTNWRSFVKMDVDAILKELPPSNRVCITGGEPFLQDLTRLVHFLRRSGKLVHVETNGTVDVPYSLLSEFTHITVSPKRDTELRIGFAHEVRVVLVKGQKPDPHLLKRFEGAVFYVSPAWDGLKPVQENIKWCVDFVSQPENEPWRLSTQLHKWIGVR